MVAVGGFAADFERLDTVVDGLCQGVAELLGHDAVHAKVHRRVDKRQEINQIRQGHVHLQGNEGNSIQFNSIQ
jgi:hypothetical protein